MRKRMFGIVCMVLLISVVFGVGTVYGASSKPGSSGDPLITLSYLNERLAGNQEGASYQKVTIEKGKRILLTQGSVAVLYSGSANVTGSEGLVDLSSSSILKANSQVSAYHSYLSPSNGSGLTMTSKAVVFIQGSYTVK